MNTSAFFRIGSALLVAASFLSSLTAPARAATTPRGPVVSRVPASCALAFNPTQFLNCYLSHPTNVAIAQSIRWTMTDKKPYETLEWKDWPAARKIELAQAYMDVIAWRASGMSYYPGTQSADPPYATNTAALMQGAYVPGVTITEADAWSIYKGYVALQLASEIRSWVPWSLHELDDYEIWATFRTGMNLCDPNSANVCLAVGATPAHATATLKFLISNNLVGPTRLETIARLVGWSRDHLNHYIDGGGWQGNFDSWQYWGYAPISRIIAGTVNPKWPQFGVRHWTAGCNGTTQFLKWLLKTVNIPVENVGMGGHISPSFPSEKRYLSHGDDPYSAVSKAGYPAELLLIDEAKYQAWFPANDPAKAAFNVGRRPIELALQYPGSAWIIERYCDDVKNNRQPAASRVYNEVFSKFYSVADLQMAGTWTKLAQVAACQK